MVVTAKQYEEEKKLFFIKHNYDFNVETTGRSAEYYRKTYSFEDGAVWYEVMTYEDVTEEVEIKYCLVTVTVAMMRIEFWNTENSESKYYYEPWKTWK